MANIIPKLNLNRTPNIVEDNSLVFAKNIKIDVDGSIHKDYSIKPLSIFTEDGKEYNADNIVKKAMYDISKSSLNTTNNAFYTYIYDKLNTIKNAFKIVKVIPDSNDFYILIHSTTNNISVILKYSESTKKLTPCNCNWKWNGGEVDGNVVNTLLEETILLISEKNTDVLTPLKCINLSKSKYTDDESLYTQTPNIPITNIKYHDVFSYSIPNGVYQFYIRYKVRDGFYTDWFLASRDLFVGNSYTTNTSFGNLKYINTHRDSDTSFVLKIEHLYPHYIKNYESFQIGFICSHDDSVVARKWKHFSFDKEIIKFDLKTEDIEDAEVVDFTKPTYNLYNVGNIANFKNKIYISNYKETNFNEDFNSLAKNIKVDIIESNGVITGDNPFTALTELCNDKTYITGIKPEGDTAPTPNYLFYGFNGLLNTEYTAIQNRITNYISGTSSFTDSVSNTTYGVTFNIYGTSLNNAKEAYENSLTVWNNHVTDLVFTDDITSVNDISVKTIEEAKAAIMQCIYKYNTMFNAKTGVASDSLGNEGSIQIVTIKRACSYKYDGVQRYGLYPQDITIRTNFDVTKYTSDIIADDITSYTTLIPYQTYRFFIHYVKQTGEITNGYKCGEDVTYETYLPEANKLLIPTFKNVHVPDGYVAYFFSMAHIKTKVATICDYGLSRDIPGVCMELNTNILPVSKTFNCIQFNSTYKGKYYHSSDSSNLKYFGDIGVVAVDRQPVDKLLYILEDYAASDNDELQLIKCTPYIHSMYQDYGLGNDEFKDFELKGYLCDVNILDRNRARSYYTDGSTVYRKSFISTLDMTELNKYKDDAGNIELKEFAEFPNTDNKHRIYSNYNFNYLALTEEPKQSIKSYYNYKSNEIPKETSETTTDDSSSTTTTTTTTTTTSIDSSPRSIMLKLLTSLTLCNCYEFPSMYRNHTNKTFYQYTNKNIYEFNNTVRSSKLEGDESEISVFKFEANDYYNIPTNRGTITSMASIGDAILVHTKNSMFRFTGSNTLSSSNGEIQTTESQPFDTGVSEMFGSEYGFAGLQNKNHCCISENGYIFFDKDAKVIYQYAGQNQISKISESIEKIFNMDEILDVRFASDYYRNRFFVCIRFANNKRLTLSYSTLEISKSFVSTHDFYFTNAFNTKNNCYFVDAANKDILTIDTKTNGYYYNLHINDTLYPYSYKVETKTYEVDSQDTIGFKNSEIVSKCNSIVEIISNQSFETVKTLNSISWCSSIVDNYYPTYSEYNKLTEPIKIQQPCTTLKVYTDTCTSDEFDCTHVANNYSVSDPNSYKYPRYNQGYWSFNCFRDIENTTDVFNYLQKTENNSAGNPNNWISDNNGLIEGKYFVIHFEFDKEFKLETLTTKYNNKL